MTIDISLSMYTTLYKYETNTKALMFSCVYSTWLSQKRFSTLASTKLRIFEVTLIVNKFFHDKYSNNQLICDEIIAGGC